MERNPETSNEEPNEIKHAPEADLDSMKERIEADPDLVELLEEWEGDNWRELDGQEMRGALYVAISSLRGVDADDLLTAKGILA